MLSGLRYLRSQRRRPCGKGMALTQGPVTGELPPALLPIEEHGRNYWSISGPQNRLLSDDQRDSRLATRRYVENRRVLDTFSYTGGFAVSALMGGCRGLSAWMPHRMRWTLIAGRKR